MPYSQERARRGLAQTSPPVDVVMTAITWDSGDGGKLRAKVSAGAYRTWNCLPQDLARQHEIFNDRNRNLRAVRPISWTVSVCSTAVEGVYDISHDGRCQIHNSKHVDSKAIQWSVGNT